MLRIDLWKSKLKAAKAELKIRKRDNNAATRAYEKCVKTIAQLEGKINAYLART
jgi:hypothetical protein